MLEELFYVRRGQSRASKARKIIMDEFLVDPNSIPVDAVPDTAR